MHPSAVESSTVLPTSATPTHDGDPITGARDRIDPELRAVLEDSPTPFLRMLLSERALTEKRKVVDELCAGMLESKAADDRVKKEDRMIPGPPGAPDVRVRIYRPADQGSPLPGLCWAHGGGMIMGKPELSELTVSSYVQRIGCVAVSIDYRLAPEHQHPAAIEDCYAGLLWTAQHAQELEIDAARLAIGGESAGGGLAAATALLARDRGGPALIFQLLVCPMLDDRNVTASSYEITDIGVWDRRHNVEAWSAVLGKSAGDPISPYAAPARATDLSGLPAAYIDAGELDVFRDEDIEYAARLARAGVPAELHVYPGAFHGWDAFAPKAAVSKRANAERRDALRRALHSVHGPI